MSILKLLAVAISLIISTTLVSPAWATCSGSSPLWSSTPDYASVSQCVTNAQAGDTVQISSGTATWSTALSITKSITLIGAGKGNTVITDGVTNDNMITIGDSLTNAINPRISSMTINGSASKSHWSLQHKAAITVLGKSRDLGFRIDKINFHNVNSIGVGVWGWTWGVIDNCDFDSINASWSILIYQAQWGGEGDYGDKSWSLPDNFGSQYFVFVEDCIFNNNSGSVIDYVESYGGSRYVYRYNTFNNGRMIAHGTDSTPRSRGTRIAEIYGNRFINNLAPYSISDSLEWRSGTAVFYDNTSSGTSGVDNGIALKLRNTNTASWWPPCDGTFALDQNQAGLNGYLCLDQPGAGQSDYISGGSGGENGWLGITPYQWPHQASSPIYIWGNSGFNRSSASSSHPSMIQLNRDYFLNEKPGYVPYPHPHPLVDGTTTYTVTPMCAVGGATCTGANGSISPNIPQTVTVNTTTTFIVAPDSGYSALVGGTCGGIFSGSTYTTKAVSSDCTVIASFSPVSYVLNVSKLGTGSGTVTSSPAGIACGSNCTAAFSQGSTITLTAATDPGSSFAGWSGACSGTGVCQVTINGDTTVTARFEASGATISAASCSSDDVGVAISNARDGDTVLIPEGNCTWTSSVDTNNKRITLQGEGQNKTVLTLSATNRLNITNNVGQTITVRGFTVKGQAGTEGLIKISGTVKDFRITDMYFNWTSCGSSACSPDKMLYVKGLANGVVDNCTFAPSTVQQYRSAIGIEADSTPNAFGRPSALGTGASVYIEDNIFTQPSTVGYTHAVWSQNGGSYVFRHNTVTNWSLDVHGHCTSGGSREFEIYDNIFTATANYDTATVKIRGGTGVIFNNTYISNGNRMFGEELRMQEVDSGSICNAAVGGGPCHACTYPAIYQIGRGTSNALDPLYMWNNKLDGENVIVNANQGWWPTTADLACCSILPMEMSQAGRDYYSSQNTPRPDYTAFIHPHPLVVGTTDTTPPVTIASPSGGVYTTTQTVTLSCSDGFGSGCHKTYYSTDGSTPINEYVGEITISAPTTTLKYFSTDLAGNSETIKTEIYRINPSATDITPPATTAYMQVILSCSDGSGSGCYKTYYTADGWPPTTESPEYAAPLILSSSTTIKYFSIDLAGNPEEIKTMTFSMNPGDSDIMPPVTAASPLGGIYATPQTVTLTCTDAGSGCNRTYYTIDGNPPTEASTDYTGPITISTTTTLKYFSIDFAGNKEAVKSQAYTIGSPAGTTLFSENFDGTVPCYPSGPSTCNNTWQPFGSIADLTYTGTVLEGAHSFLIDSSSNWAGAGSPSWPAASTTYGYFKIRFRTLPIATGESAIVDLRNGSTVVAQISTHYHLGAPHLRISNGSTTAATGTLVLNTTDTYSVWFEYTAGSGGNGVSKLWVSTTNTKPANPESQTTTGTATMNMNNLQIQGTADFNDFIIDAVKIDGQPIEPGTTLFSENFDGTVPCYPSGPSTCNNTWQPFGSIADLTYTGTVLEGAHSFLVDSSSNWAGAGSPTWTAASTTYGYFKIKFRTLPIETGESAIVDLRNGSTVFAQISTHYHLGAPHLRISNGSTIAPTGMLVLNTMDTYSVWFEFTAGSGGNGVSKVWVSTTTTKPANPESQTATGTATLNINNLQIQGVANFNDFIVDTVRIDGQPI